MIYKGPFECVTDDKGYEFDRGDRIAVSNVHFNALLASSFADDFVFIEPNEQSCCASTWDTSMFSLRTVSDSKIGLKVSANHKSSCC